MTDKHEELKLQVELLRALSGFTPGMAHVGPGEPEYSTRLRQVSGELAPKLADAWEEALREIERLKEAYQDSGVNGPPIIIDKTDDGTVLQIVELRHQLEDVFDINPDEAKEVCDIVLKWHASVADELRVKNERLRDYVKELEGGSQALACVVFRAKQEIAAYKENPAPDTLANAIAERVLREACTGAVPSRD